MAWVLLLLTAIAWFFGVVTLKFGLQINEQTHQGKNVFDYAPTGIAGDFSIIGFIIDILFSLTIGVILKYSPWWIAKSLTIIVSCIFFLLGILALIKIRT